MWKGLAGYSISGHKIHGPKGIGMLVYDSRLVLNPQMHGGKQQYGIRSGTLPLPLIVGLETAIKNAVEKIDQTHEHLRSLSCHLVQGLQNMQERLPELNIKFNSLVDDNAICQSPGIVNFSFPPVEGEVILHHLEAKDIYVGLGSACSAQSKEPSKILLGIGLNEEQAVAWVMTCLRERITTLHEMAVNPEIEEDSRSREERERDWYCGA